MWNPYVQNINNSEFLLDQTECHNHSNFIDSVQLLSTRVVEIPGGFTYVSRPCDVGIMKLFKPEFLDLYQEWKVTEDAELGGTGKIPILGRVQIFEFLDVVWKSFHLKWSKILSKNEDVPVIWELILTLR